MIFLYGLLIDAHSARPMTSFIVPMVFDSPSSITPPSCVWRTKQHMLPDSLWDKLLLVCSSRKEPKTLRFGKRPIWKPEGLRIAPHAYPLLHLLTHEADFLQLVPDVLIQPDVVLTQVGINLGLEDVVG